MFISYTLKLGFFYLIGFPTLVWCANDIIADTKNTQNNYLIRSCAGKSHEQAPYIKQFKETITPDFYDKNSKLSPYGLYQVFNAQHNIVGYINIGYIPKYSSELQSFEDDSNPFNQSILYEDTSKPPILLGSCFVHPNYSKLEAVDAISVLYKAIFFIVNSNIKNNIVFKNESHDENTILSQTIIFLAPKDQTSSMYAALTLLMDTQKLCYSKKLLAEDYYYLNEAWNYGYKNPLRHRYFYQELNNIPNESLKDKGND